MYHMRTLRHHTHTRARRQAPACVYTDPLPPPGPLLQADEPPTDSDPRGRQPSGTAQVVSAGRPDTRTGEPGPPPASSLPLPGACSGPREPRERVRSAALSCSPAGVSDGTLCLGWGAWCRVGGAIGWGVGSWGGDTRAGPSPAHLRVPQHPQHPVPGAPPLAAVPCPSR